ncbi:3-oxoacyl-[acyl-carrier-protein] synthase 3 [bacterium HR30]|nr:3-oxoacyl-[acyl-carrier-protein] synthase 3 [bacterium HR30]
MFAKVLAWGHDLPPTAERVGRLLPIAQEPVGPSTLAARATSMAFERSGLRNEDIDFIIFATTTPDVTFPGSACFLQDQLQCGTVPALDIRAQCAGFLFALHVAERFLRAGQYRCILLAGGEVYSSMVDYERQPDVAQLFGDGAGVVILGPSGNEAGIEAVVTHADGSGHRAFWCEFPASRQHPHRVTREDFGLGRHLPRIDSQVVASFGREHLPHVVREVIERAGRRVSEIDGFVLSHVFPEVAQDAARVLGLPKESVWIPSEDYGHLGAAALPVAVSKLVETGSLGAGAVVCLAACGSGFAWGGAVLRV